MELTKAEERVRVEVFSENYKKYKLIYKSFFVLGFVCVLFGIVGLIVSFVKNSDNVPETFILSYAIPFFLIGAFFRYKHNTYSLIKKQNEEIERLKENKKG